MNPAPESRLVIHRTEDYNARMSILPYTHRHVQEIRAYQPGKPIEETARELGLRPEDIVKLASNENPLGASPKAVEAMQRALQSSHLYPDGSAFELRSKIAAKFGVRLEQTAVGSGSSEMIELLCHTCLGEGKELIAAKYSFTMYPLMCKLFGARYVEVDNKPDWSHDLQGMLRAITPQTRLIFITNPTNPVGTMVGQDELDAFMQAVPDHVMVAFDEAYIDFAGQQPDTLRYVKRGQNAVVMRTFSKAYGLAGIRAGFVITTEEIAGLLHKVRSPFNMSSPAQAAALAALDDEQHVQKSVRLVHEGMEQYEQAFKNRGISYIPSSGNFILVNVGQGARVFQECLRRGVIIRPMDGYGLKEYVRITIGTREQNEKCLAALDAALAL